ncbi:ribonuclease HI [Thermoflavimicrobium dichotomicum]|uniref:ribonuclease H n=1 Tax=Thermoflavimicrobium dichotomicum TaxID=46223 RepID=A0A1I3LI60_9BACL|nr:ribonuclease HI [Thermoflavimicrobium dichotomicum]SFI84453.1 ribonuclease HI [Thermoflavimicrobium dichotomicum]
MKEVMIYTDGACSGNPGPGGWAAILIYGAHQKEISGGEKETTNNRMELTAVIEALKALKEPCRVKVYSDSAYIVNCFHQKWYEKWERTGFKKNEDLWRELLRLVRQHDVEFIKVKGHSDVELNNRCDELARAAITRL